MDLPGGTGVKNPCLQCGRDGFDPWVGKIPWRRKCQPTLVSLPEKFHGQRSLAGHSPWGRRELDMTEVAKQASIGTSILFDSMSDSNL